MKNDRYSFKDTLKENAGLSVYNTGFEKCDGSYIWGPAVRDHYLIHYVVSGQGTYTCDHHTYELREGDLFFIEPGKSVSYRADALDPWEYCWVGFNGTDAKRLVTLAGLIGHMPVLHSEEPQNTCQLLRRIAEVSGNTAVNDTEMAGCLYLFLAHLIRMNGVAVTENTHQEYVANALRFIQYNYANDIGVTDIANYVGISRSQLYRAFVQDFGVSPHHYLQKYRISAACTLLRNPGLSVAEVSGSVGFNDPLYFSRVFKAIKGRTPTEYQHSLHQKANLSDNS